MADLNANIILGGQQFDLIGAMDRGMQLANNQNALNRQREIEALYRTQGNALMQGDQNALARLAQYDPSAAMGLQGQQLDMQATQQRMNALDEQSRRQAEEYARGLSAEQRAAELAALEDGVKRALAAPTPEAFDAMMVEIGRPDMVGQFENRQSLAAPYMEIADILKMTAGPEAIDPGDRYRVVGDSLVDLGGEGGPAAVDLGLPPKVDAGAATDIRKEWIGIPAVKTFQTQSDAFGRIVAAASNDTGAADVALVYSYMKMLDPGSVVREGEFATAEQTAGLDQRIVGVYNKLVNGGRLTPEMRAAFVDQAGAIYGNAEAEYDALRSQYEGIATRLGIPVEDALPDFRYSGKRTIEDDSSGSQGATGQFDPAEIDQLMLGP